jgi:hypothetical protein
MTFEFNSNNVRSNDGNDPQDHSLGGEGGLFFDRVPSRSQVVSTNKSQGQALGCQGQGQAIYRDGQAQGLACVGPYQARGGQAHDSAGQASGPQGLNGVEGVPSHVSIAASVASTSVIPTSRYFGAKCRFAAEINANQVMCPKHACGAHGSHDYACHQEGATKPLSNPFTSAKHFHAKNAEGEASNKYASPV